MPNANENVEEIYVTQTRGNFLTRIMTSIRLNRFLSKKFKQMKNLNAEEIMETANVRGIFLNFVDLHPNNENMKKQMECYALCTAIITNTVDVTELSIIMKIIDLALNDVWRNTLKRAFFNSYGNTKFIIEKLRDECLIEIECDVIYHLFMAEVRGRKGNVKKLLMNEFDYKEFLESWAKI